MESLLVALPALQRMGFGHWPWDTGDPKFNDFYHDFPIAMAIFIPNLQTDPHCCTYI
jgi:hypothetical protein